MLFSITLQLLFVKLETASYHPFGRKLFAVEGTPGVVALEITHCKNVS
jgi:hypothetical protein